MSLFNRLCGLHIFAPEILGRNPREINVSETDAEVRLPHAPLGGYRISQYVSILKKYILNKTKRGIFFKLKYL